MAPRSTTNGTNGYRDSNGTDIYQIDTRLGSTSTGGKYSDNATNTRASQGPFPPLAKAVKHRPLKADREGITAAFSQFGQLIQTPRKPLPTQAGEGTQSVRKTTTGFRVDRKYIGWKGDYFLCSGCLLFFAKQLY